MQDSYGFGVVAGIWDIKVELLQRLQSQRPGTLVLWVRQSFNPVPWIAPRDGRSPKVEGPTEVAIGSSWLIKFSAHAPRSHQGGNYHPHFTFFFLIKFVFLIKFAEPDFQNGSWAWQRILLQKNLAELFKERKSIFAK